MNLNNLVVMPMFIPLFAAVILVFLRSKVRLQKIILFLSMCALIVVNIVLLVTIKKEGIQTLAFGGWEAPFGISFVADSFAMLFVTTASVVSLLCILFAFRSFEESFEKMFVYPLILLMIAGVNGSFLTGDIFNLFVCFEVMLLASYVLITIGGGKERLRESLKYVLINVLASWVFLVGLAMVYGSLGTLNFAHMAERVDLVHQGPVLTTISLMLLVVFSLKAGLFLFYWLPGSYRVPTVPIAAMFGALLTKVGIYAIFRTFTLIFPIQEDVTHTLIGLLALATIILGMFGAIGYRDLRQIVGYNVIIGVGFVLMALYANNATAFEGSIYYLIHDMIIKALLFLMIGTMMYITGRASFDEIKGLIHQFPLFGWLFFMMVLALTGIPPFSGFLGKVLIGQGLIESGYLVGAVIAMLSSIVVLYSLIRVFLKSIFGEATLNENYKKKIPKQMMFAMTALGALSICLGLGAELLAPYVKDAVNVLVNPTVYIDAVLYK